MKRQRCGFTIIELLVIIAILAILAAILFPIVAQPREPAKVASCLSQHKQLGTGIMMYIEDYDGKFPMTANLSAPDKTLWTQAIFPYAKNKKVFLCPQAKRDLFWRKSSPTSLHATIWEERNYASIGLTSQLLFDKTGKNGFTKAIAINDIAQPADSVLLADTRNAEIDRPKTAYQGGYTFDPCSLQGKNGMPPIATPTTPVSVHNAITNRHHQHYGGIPITFADGHAKMFRPAELGKLQWRFRGCP
jgi:prepilin-type N-terminal cleavage/methylation domain-containing protein/prepilin-type processing-associated H-X9-DG protein